MLPKQTDLLRKEGYFWIEDHSPNLDSYVEDPSRQDTKDMTSGEQENELNSGSASGALNIATQGRKENPSGFQGCRQYLEDYNTGHAAAWVVKKHRQHRQVSQRAMMFIEAVLNPS
ncbi:hypothetical protein CVT25_012482 [Psilocybe cyanescens]|uniref:Uncharacterized protein n=1 Tax=Psilocybe cyanescens TaxID=93625 RepID=A0A409XHF6_PSICY|nr:hypothetical protein CVT25_012482 [Psilocybe cyanescens]